MFIRISCDEWLTALQTETKKSDTFFHRLSLRSFPVWALGVRCARVCFYSNLHHRRWSHWLPVTLFRMRATTFISFSAIFSRRSHPRTTHTHRELIGGPTATITISDVLNFRYNKTPNWSFSFCFVFLTFAAAGQSLQFSIESTIKLIAPLQAQIVAHKLGKLPMQRAQGTQPIRRGIFRNYLIIVGGH